MRWDFVAATHVLGACAHGGNTEDDGRSGNGADRGVRVAVGIARAFGGEGVEFRGAGGPVAVATEVA